MQRRECHCGWSKVTTNHGLRTHQGRMSCTEGLDTPPTPPTGPPIQLKEPENFIPPTINLSQMTLNDHIHPAAADVTVDETHETFFQTPEPPPRHQTATNTDRPCRALNFSTGAEQTTPPTTAVRPREDEEEEQREAEKLDKRAELQERIQIRQQKMAEVKSSVFKFKVSLDNECEEINNVFSEVKKVVEDVLQSVEERKKRVKKEGDELLQELERETEELQKTIAELDRNPDLQISPETTVPERGFRLPLPMILLSNVRSLCNKMEELRLLITTNTYFADSSVLCFTESWLTVDIPNSAVQLNGFQLLRADRDLIRSGKERGGGICFYINDRWCNKVKVTRERYCSPDLETFFITCTPFYPHEFTSFILAGVYIQPEADVCEAQSQLADQIKEVERRSENKSSTVIVLGDFNQAKLPPKLSKYKQFVKCPTRGENTLDHCYSTISEAYHAVPRAPLGRSDHAVIHLIPPYIQNLKLSEPAVLRIKNWSSRAAVDELRDCLAQFQFKF